MKNGPPMLSTEAIAPIGNHRSLLVANLQAAHVLRFHAVFRIGLGVYLPGSTELIEIVDVEAAEVNLQRLEDVTKRDAHRFTLRPIDIDE